MTRKALPLTLALLLGCGGGGDGTLAPGTPTVGVLTDSPVSGVSYETESKSGVTDDEGKFEYKVGETVTFRIGSVELGSGEAKPETSPFDLVPGATPITKTPRIIEALMEDETFWQVVNLAVFLQTLDDDDYP